MHTGKLFFLFSKFDFTYFILSRKKYKTTHSFMVPPLMVFLAKHPLVDKYDMSSLRELYCGAAPLSKEVEDAVMKRIPNVTVIFINNF